MSDTAFLTRRAHLDDVTFLAKIDLAVDVEDVDDPNETLYCDGWGEAEYAAHRAKIATFVTQADKSAWVVESIAEGNLVGMVLASCHRALNGLSGESQGYLNRLVDEGILPGDMLFVEVFQLWVDPAYRRRGIGSELKLCIEGDARAFGAKFLYTHTRASNLHVVKLNLKLGYVEVRRGPLWDPIERVSLIKWL